MDILKYVANVFVTNLPRVRGGFSRDHMVEVCEYFRFYGSAQAEAQKEDAASNRRCEPCLSHLGFDKCQL